MPFASHPPSTGPSSPDNLEDGRSNGNNNTVHKGVASQAEQSTGRWTKAEHDAFLAGLKEYGKEWKKVAARVGTRTVVQTRTHAQKYFQKLAKQDTPGSATIKSSTAVLSTTVVQPSLTKSSVLCQQQQQQQQQRAAEDNALKFMARNFSNNNLLHIATTAYKLGTADTPPPVDEPYEYASKAELEKQQQEQKRYLPPTTVSSSKRLKVFIPQPQHPQNPQHRNQYTKLSQPSPAACGHRKKDEVAAATLLANFDGKKPLPGTSISVVGSLPATISTKHGYKATPPMHNTSASYLQIINPEKLPGLPAMSSNGSSNEPTTPFDVQVQEILPREGPSLPTATPDSSDMPSDSQQIGISPAFKSLVMHDDPTLTLLHHAVIELDYNLVANLIGQCGSNPVTRASQPHGFTMLHSLASLASREGCDSSGGGDGRRSSALLLMLGILNHVQWNVNQRDTTGGNSPLHFACHISTRRPNSSVNNFAIEGEQKNSHLAEEMVKWLIERGADRDATNFNKHTPLHLALAAGVRGMGVTRKLLEMGCSVSCYDYRGMGCIQAACSRLSLFPDSAATESKKQARVDSTRGSESDIQVTLQNFFQHSPRARTLIVAMKKDEFIRNIHVIYVNVNCLDEINRAPLEDLQLAHSNAYIANLVQYLSSEELRRHRQKAGAALHTIDRVMMDRVRNSAILVPPYKKLSQYLNTTASIGSESNQDMILNSTSTSYNSDSSIPFNVPIIATFHTLCHARCKKCAIIDLNTSNSYDQLFDDNIKNYNESSRLLYYRVSPSLLNGNSSPSDSSRDNQCSAKLQFNVIEANGGEDNFRSEFTTKLLPTLRAFSPDFVIIRVNQLHKHLSWATSQICTVANMCCQGRIVSIIETNSATNSPQDNNTILSHLKVLIDSHHDFFDIG